MSDTIISSSSISEQIYTWIRRQNIEFNITGCKPNTRHWAYFDRTPVNHLIIQNGKSLGDPVITDANGNASGVFVIPSYTFYTGNKELLFSDESSYPNEFGTQSSDASSIFSSRVIRTTVKDTINIIQLVPEHWTRWGDPLAQSFFTFGTEGGVSVTSIDIFFQKKDPTVPIVLEIRQLNNGYPSEKLVYPYARVTIPSANVNTSSNASVATKFKFPVPIFLSENQGYCFVLLSNSDNYWVWTSKMGERSIESGTYISSQPYIGSMFKSENNITWTAEQDSDIKFRMNRAEFSPQATLKFGAMSEPVLLEGKNLSVTTGSNDVTVKFDHYHGLLSGDLIDINAKNYFLYNTKNRDSISYRGISGDSLTGTFPVTVLDDYTVKFVSPTTASSSGTLSIPGIINDVVIESGGTGYTINSVITFSGGGASKQAEASVSSVGTNGSITSIKILNHGKGYTSIPKVTISGGSGAIINIISQSIFKISTNRVVNEYLPRVSIQNPPYTSSSSSLTYTRQANSNFERVSTNKIDLNNPVSLPYKSTLLSPSNNNRHYSSFPTAATELIIDLKTNNTKVSPTISLNEHNQLESRCYVINNQEGDDLSSNDPNKNTELKPVGGKAKSRYVTKQFTLDTVSNGIRLYLNAYSEKDCNIDTYIRTSLSTDDLKHQDLYWTKLNCDTERNLSKSIGDFIDYTFYLDNIPAFDTYDIKIVMRSLYRHKAPTIKNYRVIILS